jgi:hypothetical protein
LAADAVEDGQMDAAKQWLGQVQRNGLNAHNAFLFDMTTAVLTMAAAAEANRPAVFLDVQRAVGRAVAGYRNFARSPARRRFYRRCVWMIARYRGGSRAKLWAAWQSLGATIFPLGPVATHQ